MDLRLDGRTALVTGGPAGSVARTVAFSPRKARTSSCWTSTSKAPRASPRRSTRTRTVGTAGAGTVEAVGCDLTDREDVRETIEDVHAEFGGIDVLMNNAAMVDARARMPDYDDEI